MISVRVLILFISTLSFILRSDSFTEAARPGQHIPLQVKYRPFKTSKKAQVGEVAQTPNDEYENGDEGEDIIHRRSGRGSGPRGKNENRNRAEIETRTNADNSEVPRKQGEKKQAKSRKVSRGSNARGTMRTQSWLPSVSISDPSVRLRDWQLSTSSMKTGTETGADTDTDIQGVAKNVTKKRGRKGGNAKGWGAEIHLKDPEAEGVAAVPGGVSLSSLRKQLSSRAASSFITLYLSKFVSQLNFKGDRRLLWGARAVFSLYVVGSWALAGVQRRRVLSSERRRMRRRSAGKERSSEGDRGSGADVSEKESRLLKSQRKMMMEGLSYGSLSLLDMTHTPLLLVPLQALVNKLVLPTDKLSPPSLAR